MRSVVCALICAAAASGQNLLVNGSFEQPGDDWWVGLRAGSTHITGWVVTRDTVDYHTGSFPCSDGRFCLDLDGTPGYGAIAQTFATAAGATYNVTFDMAGNMDGLPVVKQLRVRAAGQQADFSFDTTGRSRTSMGWTAKSWAFTAAGAQTTLEFLSLDTVNGWHGPMLDNVRVTGVSAVPVCSYTISPTTATLPAGGGTGSVGVTAGSGCSWTAVSGVSWITITAGTSGTGNGTVSYSAAANTGTSARSGTLTIAGQTFTLTQSTGTTPGCTYTISPASATAPASGGTGSVTVTATSGCAWTAVSGVTWIRITAGASGTGGGTVSYSVSANAGTSARTGALTIAGRTFPVNQSGAGAAAAPSINAGGVVNAADYTAAFAPGMIVSIAGSNLAPASEKAGEGVLPVTLQGSSVEVVDGTRVTKAPLFLVSPGEIRAQLPYDTISSGVQVRVRTAGGVSGAQSIILMARCPRLLTVSGDGKGEAWAVRGDRSAISADSPASPGGAVVLYAAGLGEVDPAATAGTPGREGEAGSPSSKVTAPVTVRLGGVEIAAVAAGLAPGLPGVYQVSFALPEGMPAGMAEVILAVGGVVSQAGVSLAVSPVAWKPLAASSISSGGGTVAAGGMSLSIPAGSFSAVSEVRIYEAVRGRPASRDCKGTVFGLAGLPSSTYQPITITIQSAAPLPTEDKVYLVLEWPGPWGSEYYLKARVEGTRVVATLPARRPPAPESDAGEAARPETRIAGPRAGTKEDLKLVILVYLLFGDELRTEGKGFEVLYSSDVPRSYAVAAGAWLEWVLDWVTRPSERLSTAGLIRESLPVPVIYVGRYGKKLAEEFGEIRVSPSTNSTALKLDADYLDGLWPRPEGREKACKVPMFHLALHWLTSAWDARPEREQTAEPHRWLWLDEAVIRLVMWEGITRWEEERREFWQSDELRLIRAGLDFVHTPVTVAAAREHGYDAADFVSHLNLGPLNGKPWLGLLYRMKERIGSPVEALALMVEDLGSDWGAYCRELAEEVAGERILNSTAANRTIFSDSRDLLRKSALRLPNLSAQFFEVRLDYRYAADAVLEVEVPGGQGIYPVVFRPGKPPEDFLPIPFDYVAGDRYTAKITLPDLYQLYEQKQNLVVMVVNARAGEPYGGATQTTLTIRVNDMAPNIMDLLKQSRYLAAYVNAEAKCWYTPGEPELSNQCPDFSVRNTFRPGIHVEEGDLWDLNWTGDSVLTKLERTLTGGSREEITIQADFAEGGFMVDSLTATYARTYSRKAPDSIDAENVVDSWRWQIRELPRRERALKDLWGVEYPNYYELRGDKAEVGIRLTFERKVNGAKTTGGLKSLSFPDPKSNYVSVQLAPR